MKTIILIIIIIVLGAGCYYLFLKKDNWIGFYYPDSWDLTYHTQSPEFNSIEECRVWIEAQVPIHNPSGDGYDYECGKNCKFDKDFGAYICKETTRQ